MIYGVFSDIHSNLEALTQVLDFFANFGVDGYICCGDLVGYGPNPEECLAKIQSLKNASIVCGNHDLAAIGRLDSNWFNPYARSAILWTKGVLSPQSRSYLGSLATRLETADFTLVHGTPRKPIQEYLLSTIQFKDNLPLVRVWPLFMGHSHMPLCFRMRGNEKSDVESLLLEDRQEVNASPLSGTASPVAFNPGSVGQPRDHDRKASCGLYDSEKRTFRIVRLDYDVAAVQEKIRQLGLPEFLALRLAYGQ